MIAKRRQLCECFGLAAENKIVLVVTIVYAVAISCKTVLECFRLLAMRMPKIVSYVIAEMILMFV